MPAPSREVPGATDDKNVSAGERGQRGQKTMPGQRRRKARVEANDDDTGVGENNAGADDKASGNRRRGQWRRKESQARQNVQQVD